MPKQITLFEHQLPLVFEEWKRQCQADPEAFDAITVEGYGEKAARDFLGILREVQAQDRA